ncbi:MAG: alpha/beta fold hydrolase [Pseudomonadota bacterium]|nr:alpha/beta fold hydrolase [Pseudomonadota bacterium]MBU1398919.1 alpha/beta fold hydrolase [Pseudomonadota bacterium]MBU1571053.1 alpha/beta fold hydrolase [Pseudomonadota bacterium]
MATEKHIDISGIKHLYPFKSNYTEIKGIKFHYIDEGSGNPVLMIHGNPTWSFYFRSLIRELSPNFRTIAPDHIGCGLSGKPDPSDYDYRLKSRVEDIDLFLGHLKLNGKITLILHDWGGMIGMAYAVRNPKKISSVVIMNTAAFFPPGRKKKISLRLRMIRNISPFADIAVLGLNLFVKSALYMASYKGLSRDVKNGLIAPYNSWKNRVAVLKFVQDIPLCENDPSYGIVKDVEDNLHRLSEIPMLICWGKHDFVFTENYLAEWRKRFPGAETHIFENAGHYVLEDEPEKISSAIKDFLNRHVI